MFKLIIEQVRSTLTEMNRIMGPPKPTVGAGMKPAGPKPSLKPAITPAQEKPHGMGGTGMAKAMGGASKPATAMAGKQKPVSSGAVTGMGHIKSNPLKPNKGPAQPKPPAPGSSSGQISKGSSLKMNGMGKGRENL